MSTFVNYGDLLHDEISLEGRCGITIQQLWNRIEERVGCSLPLTLKNKLWSMVKTLKYVDFYSKNPRFKTADSSTSDSGLQFREDITEQVKEMPLDKYIENYGSQIFLVASEIARWRVLAPNAIITQKDILTPAQYDLLESVGKSRNTGVASFESNSALPKIQKDVDSKAAKAAFYMRKSLLAMGLIWQEHTVVNGKTCIRFRLERFRKNMSKLSEEEESRIKVMERVLKENNNYAPFIEIKNALGVSPKQLKLWLKTKFPFREMFKIVSGIYKNRTRIYVVPRLADNKQLEIPCTDYDWKDTFTTESSKVETDVETGNNSCEIGEDEDGPWTRDVTISLRHKLPLAHQAHLALSAFGPDGATLLEISKSLGFGWRLTRCALKMLQNAGVVKRYMVDYQRLRYARYYVDDFKQSSKSKSEFTIQYERLAKNLLNFESEYENGQNAYTFSEILDNIQITITPAEKKSHDKELRDIILHAKGMNKSKMHLCSLRYLSRLNTILEVVHINKIVAEYYQLRRLLQEYQVETNDQVSALDLIDRKVFQRLMDQMYSLDLIKIYKAVIHFKRHTRTRILVCLPQLVITEQMIVKLLDTDLRSMSLLDREEKNQLAGVQPFEYRVPKMERARIIHEFVFQLTFGKNDITDNTSVIKDEPVLSNQDDAFSTKKRKEIKLGDHDISLNETQLANLSDNNIAPPAGWPQGWIKIDEAIKLIPQNIFLQLSTLNTASQVSGAIFGSICFIANMGLINFDKTGQYIYINRYATLVEKSDHLKREHKFHFTSQKAVKIYWDFLRKMCLKHKDTIVRNQNKDEKINKPKVERSHIVKLIKPGIEPDEGPSLDRGVLPGNGCGFAGFDSSVVVAKKVSWHRHVTTTDVKVCPKRKRPCLPRDSHPVVPKKKKKKHIPKNKGFQLRVIPKDNGVKNRKDLSLPRRKLVWKPEELHVIFLARIAGALMLHGKVVSVRISCHMRSILINVCEMIFKGAGINAIIRPFIYRRLKLLSASRQMQRVLDVKLTEAKDIAAFREYIGLYHTLRSIAKRMTEVKPKLQTATLELILGLHRAQVIKNISSLKVFHDIKSLHKAFKITVHDKKAELFEKPKCAEDIEHITIQNAAVAVLGSADEANWTPVLSKVLDKKLRVAVKALQVQGIVALRNKFYRLSQNYVSTVAALNSVTIELQTDLEDIASGRSKVIEIGAENLPYIEGKPLVRPSIKDNPKPNIDLSKFEKLMTTLKIVINEAQDMGCSGEDLKLLLRRYDKDCLCCISPQHDSTQTCTECLHNIENCLDKLTTDKELYKVGYDAIKWVSKNYQTHWTIGGVHPEPWTKADGSIAETAFFRWMGTVLWCILDQPGISCMDLASKLHFLRPTQITTLVKMLEKIGSVQTQTIDMDDFGLTSPDDFELTLHSSLNLDPLDCVLISPTPDAVSVYEIYKKTIPNLDQFDSKIEIASGLTNCV